MKKILWVRHGLTDYLRQNRYQGWSDTPLNREGKSEIRSLRNRICQENVEVIFSSPLKRALESARTLARYLRLDVEVDERLKEMNFGAWEGMTYDEITTKFPEAFRWWERDLLTFKPAGGESINELRMRVESFLRDLAAREEETILIVTHGGVIRSSLLHFLDLPAAIFWKFELATAGLTTVNQSIDHCSLASLNWKPVPKKNSVYV